MRACVRAAADPAPHPTGALGAGGGISVAHAKNVEAYGDVKPAHILDGTVEPPPEMQVRAGQPGAWLQDHSPARGAQADGLRALRAG